ncbi:hypothetical protein [Streptomyces sp. NPDC058394]|uniref:hypothetical protein n=1 Tax=Streptomyces sp. NPDC058394 TaxID=3346477 RepID=UPI00364AA183
MEVGTSRALLTTASRGITSTRDPGPSTEFLSTRSTKITGCSTGALLGELFQDVLEGPLDPPVAAAERRVIGAPCQPSSTVLTLCRRISGRWRLTAEV